MQSFLTELSAVLLRLSLRSMVGDAAIREAPRDGRKLRRASDSMIWRRSGLAVFKTVKIVGKGLRTLASFSQSVVSHVTGTKKYSRRVDEAGQRMTQAVESLAQTLEERDRRIWYLENEIERLSGELQNNHRQRMR